MRPEIIKLAEELENEFLKKSGTGFQVSIFLCGGAGKQEGELRRAKTKMVGPRRRCKVTGLIKNTDEPRFGIGKWKKRQMRAIMHNLLIKGKTDQKYDSAESILGWLSFLKGVDKISYKQMNRTWEILLAKSSQGC